MFKKIINFSDIYFEQRTKTKLKFESNTMEIVALKKKNEYFFAEIRAVFYRHFNL